MGCGTSKKRKVPNVPSEPYDGGELVPGVIHTWNKSSVKIPKLCDLTVVSIGVSDSANLAVTRGGELYVWENDPSNAKIIQNHVRSAAIGRDHYVSAAENDTGIVGTYSWGKGENWQLGHGTQDAEAEPREIIGLRGKDIVEVFASATASAALTRTGELYMWGLNESGECGYGHTDPIKAPGKCIAGELEGRQVNGVSLGEHHTVVMCFDGTCWTWGSNSWNQLGLGIAHFGQDQYMPVQCMAMSEEPVVSVSCGQNHTAALTESSKVYTWGCNEQNQLGLAEGPDPERTHCPEQVDHEVSNHDCIRLVCGPACTVALTVEGECLACGAFPESKPKNTPHLVHGIRQAVSLAISEKSAMWLMWDDKWA